MSTRQRGETWWIDIGAPSGERIRRSAETSDRKAAQEYHDRLRAQLWREDKFGETPAKTFDQTAVRFLKHYLGQADCDSKRHHIVYWRTIFGGRILTAITADAVDEGLPKHKLMTNGKTALLTSGTKNRYIGTLRTMLNMCVTWKWLERAPRLGLLDEPKKRIRWITQAEANALIGAITQDWHVIL